MDQSSLKRDLDIAKETSFEAVLAVIDSQCDFTDCVMVINGLRSGKGESIGTKKVVGAAILLKKKYPNFLSWFSEHHKDVLKNPRGSNHANIRAIMSGLAVGKSLSEFVTFRKCENPISLKEA